jgi:hypothetical protein
MRFYDSQSERKVKATMVGFVGGKKLTSLEEFKEFFSEEFHPEKGKSFSDGVKDALEKQREVKVWALIGDNHVEAVTDSEYRQRQP